jgi:hypothetical protein
MTFHLLGATPSAALPSLLWQIVRPIRPEESLLRLSQGLSQGRDFRLRRCSATQLY